MHINELELLKMHMVHTEKLQIKIAPPKGQETSERNFSVLKFTKEQL